MQWKLLFVSILSALQVSTSSAPRRFLTRMPGCLVVCFTQNARAFMYVFVACVPPIPSLSLFLLCSMQLNSFCISTLSMTDAGCSYTSYIPRFSNAIRVHVSAVDGQRSSVSGQAMFFGVTACIPCMVRNMFAQNSGTIKQHIPS